MDSDRQYESVSDGNRRKSKNRKDTIMNYPQTTTTAHNHETRRNTGVPACRWIALVCLVCIAVATRLDAALVTPVAVSDPGGNADGYVDDYLLDSSGISPTPLTLSSTQSNAAAVGWSSQWYDNAAALRAGAWIRFDLGQEYYKLDAAHVWNYTRDNRYTTSFDLSISLDGISYTLIGDDLAMTQTTAPTAVDTFSLGYSGAPFRYIRFNDFVGNAVTVTLLGEVRFDASVPEPASLSMLALGALALLRRRRR